MTVCQDITVLENEVCYHGNQLTAVLLSCNNIEDTVLVYDPLHLDYIVVLNKLIGNTTRCAIFVTPTTFHYRSR